MKLLTSQQLRKIEFDEFVEHVSQDVQLEELTKVSLKDDEVPYCSADDFRQGSCELFALALQRKYQYPIYELRDCSSVHWFCKTVVSEQIAYIDVRGITFDFKTFLHELNVSAERDGSILYDIDRIDLESVVNKVGIAFAEWIIQNAGSRYDITTYLQI